MNQINYHFPDELESLDYFMLRGESDPRTRSPTLGVITLRGTPSLDTVKREYERASRSFIRLRQKVVMPVLPVTNPRWVTDPDFDINYHVRAVALASPGSLRQLMDLARDVINVPFDLARPLWELVFVTGLGEHGNDSALLSKLHHSVVDGVGGMLLLKEFFDFEENAPKRAMPPKPIPEDLSSTELTRRALMSLAGKSLPRLGALLQRGLAVGLEAAQNPAAAVNDLQERLESAQRMIGELPVAPSPLLKRRSLGRWVDGFALPFADLRRAAKAADCSVNDAYLAAVCSGLRRYHEAMGEPVQAVPMAIPVNVRRDDDPSGGNRFAGARLVAPIGIENPRDCMKVIRERVLSVTAEPAINLLGQLATVLNALPQPMLERFNELVAGTDVQASNVPGIPGPMWFAGFPLTGYYPIGPVPGVGIMIALVSMMGQCFVGVQLDTASVTDQALFGRCLREGFDEIIASAGPTESESTRRRGASNTKAAKTPARKSAAKVTATPSTGKQKPPARAGAAKQDVLQKGRMKRAAARKAAGVSPRKPATGTSRGARS